MKFHHLSFFIIILSLFLTACGEAASDDPTPVLEPTETLFPTPTLVPGLPTGTPGPKPESSPSAETTDLVTPTPRPSPTISPEPTETPRPSDRIPLAKQHLQNGNYDAAVEQFLGGLVSGSLGDFDRQQALYGLSVAQYERGFHQSAADGFRELLAASSSGGQEDPGFQGSQDLLQAGVPVSDAYYYLAKISLLDGDCQAAVGALESYLEKNPDMGAYILPEIASCQASMNDPLAALSSYEAAVEAPAMRGMNASLRLELARQYLTLDDYDGALAQYEALMASAESNEEMGRASYLIGSIYLALGDIDEAYRYYHDAVEHYPTAFESYLALTALVEVDYEVDDFRRGVVDYYAEAYEPAVAAFLRYLEGNEEHEEDAHLFLAWSYEGLGRVADALSQIDAYIAAADAAADAAAVAESDTAGDDGPAGSSREQEAAKGWFERARLQARSGNLPGAIDDYSSFLERFPDHPDGPLAAWRVAAFAERLGRIDDAVGAYERLARDYPENIDAAEALFRAGFLAHEAGDDETAEGIWQRAVENYLHAPYGAASLIWLSRVSGEDARQFVERADQITGADYYQIRAREIISGGTPFERPGSVDFNYSEDEQALAEVWLGEMSGIEQVSSELMPELAQDGRLVRGTKLLRIGRWQEAKTELEALRTAYRNDMLASYQLALTFRELGLYRSSILAAMDVLRLANTEVFEAPTFIGKLAYPIYYTELVQNEADKYGFDPLLQFALLLQESLFESFARSSAAAQGLSQVIPDTGEYIAERLDWPEYDNEDLYKPYVGIAFGAYYLDQQLDAFNNDTAAALSAYNAGPGNAARWYELAPHDLDLIREIVDFFETSQYIDRIYEGQAIYRFLYGQDQ